MDEDGWITVTASKKKRANDGTVKITGIKAESVILKRSKKSKILDNFYKFQKGQQRRESESIFLFLLLLLIINFSCNKELDELRKQFEEDKNRIEKMKESKQFRPFKT